MTDEQTFLEQIAYERDRRSAQWESLNAEQRRWLTLSVLNEQRITAASQQSYHPSVNSWLLAAEIAARLAIPGARRLGSQANGGHSWTGYMSPALRITTSLRHSAKQGLVRMRVQPDQRTRFLYQLTEQGLAWLDVRPYKL